jgi:PAS domain S-box-containing protein
VYPIKTDGDVEEIVLVQDDITERVEAEAALRASETRFRAVFEESRDAILVSHDLRVDFVNPEFARMFGYDGPEEIVGLPVDIVLAPGCREEVLSRARSRLAGNEEPPEYEITGLRKDGSEFPVEIRIAMYTMEGVKRQMVTFRDLTERKRTEEEIREQARTLALINQIGTSLNRQLDLDKIVQDLTEVATQLTGAQFGAFFYNVQNPSGGTYMLYSLAGAPRSAFDKFPMPRATEIFHPTFAGLGVIRSDDITKDPRYGKNEPFYGMPEGHLPVRSYLAVPVKSQAGEVIGGLFFGHSQEGVFTQTHSDMLEGIAAQGAIAIDNARLYRRLSSLNVELERRVEERTRELQAANQELEGFTYSVSHDLRAPLRAIIASSMILREDFGSVLPKDASEQLIRQAEAAKKLGTLIDELLRLSRLGRAELVRSEIDLSAMAAELAKEQSRPDITFQIDPDLKLFGDPRLLRLVLWNLIDNAAKFSPKGGTIHVGQRADGTYFVADEGIGFDMQYAHKLFLPFERLHRDDEFAGTGIGLANVQRIVNRHGGRVWAESERGKGSTFYFSMP